MVDIINHKGFNIIGKLRVKETLVPTNSQLTALTGSQKEQEFLDLSSKLPREGICRAVTEYYGLTELNDIHYYDGNLEIRLDKEGFNEFQSLVSSVLSISAITKIASKSFIEDAVFYWMIEVLKSGSDKKLLMDYVNSEIHACVKEYEFFYPMVNLKIDEPFHLGTTEFVYFTKEYVDELYNHYKTAPTPMSEEEFRKVFRVDYQGKVLAKVTVHAESGKAEELAKRQVELAVDILKIMVLGTHPTDLVNTFELNYRLNFQTRSKYLSKAKQSPMGYRLGINFENKEFYDLKNNHVEKCKQNGLLVLASFISLNNTDELFQQLINAIEMFSFALSISDLHRRIAAIITIIESLLLEDDKKYDLEKKAKARFLKVLPDSHADKQHINNTLSYIYAIRHKIVHKAIKLPIDYQELNKAQVYLIALLLNLTKINVQEGVIDKAGLFKILDARLV